MPTRADLAAARPRCRALIDTTDGRTSCVLPMRYYPGRKVWGCRKHGGRILASVLIRQQQQGQRL